MMMNGFMECLSLNNDQIQHCKCKFLQEKSKQTITSLLLTDRKMLQLLSTSWTMTQTPYNLYLVTKFGTQCIAILHQTNSIGYKIQKHSSTMNLSIQISVSLAQNAIIEVFDKNLLVKNRDAIFLLVALILFNKTIS